MLCGNLDLNPLPKMRSKIVLAALLVLSAHSASPSEAEYDQGVASFRDQQYADARLHWERATEQNVRAAYNNLAYLLYYGLGGKAEPRRAVSLWSIAAANGDREAQWHLARAYEEGKGVASDVVIAYAWYRCAASNFARAPLVDQQDTETVSDTTAAIVRISSKLSSEQLRDGDLLAKKYIEEFPYSAKWLIHPLQKNG